MSDCPECGMRMVKIPIPCPDNKAGCLVAHYVLVCPIGCKSTNPMSPTEQKLCKLMGCEYLNLDDENDVRKVEDWWLKGITETERGRPREIIRRALAVFFIDHLSGREISGATKKACLEQVVEGM